MELKSFKSCLGEEGSVKRYLVEACWKGYVRFCIRCRTKRIYRVRRDRYRCSQCGYEFTDFAGRWINKVKLPPRNWLWLIKLFELGISAREASQQSGVSYPTVHKAYHVLRQSIIAHSGDSESLLGVERKETYVENRDSKTRVPVFGILERKGLVKVESLQDLTAEAVLNLDVETVRRGSVVYTGRWGNYDGLVFSGHKHFLDDTKRRFRMSRVPTNGSNGFWSYAKERMNRFHGISEQKFPFYLKEMEFRYNHRHESILNILVGYVCDLTAM